MVSGFLEMSLSNVFEDDCVKKRMAALLRLANINNSSNGWLPGLKENKSAEEAIIPFITFI